MQQDTALSILKTGRNVYLTGAAGSGKTHVLNRYISYLREHHVGIGITASTGIAATHLGGMTIHAWAGIGIKDFLSEWDLDALSQRQALVKRFERTDVLIIDEVSMLRPEVLDMVDTVAKTLKRTREPFGGMQVVLSGDFFQLPPVVRDGTADAFIDTARAWHECDIRVCYLTEQHRQEGGALLSLLNDIRDGDVTDASSAALRERVDAKLASEPVMLYTHNKNVDSENEKRLREVDGTARTYTMAHKGRKNLIETLTKSVLAPETLTLKVGARVMFVKNSAEHGYANGTLGEVVSVSGEYPLVRTDAGAEISAYPASWEVVDDGKVLASVTQVPLRLAWAITVHKSQGMTLGAVRADLSHAFAPGQGYVALSRARVLEGLSLVGWNETALAVHPYVRELDERLQEQSQHWERVVEAFSPDRVASFHAEFIERVGRDAPPEHEEKVPTHLQTRALLEQELSLEAIAQSRSLTINTIIGHLEKLKKAGDTDVYAYLAPDDAYLEPVRDAFKKRKDDTLSPVHRALKGAYTFDELRFARLFV